MRLAGRFAIRLCITSYRTGTGDIDAVVSALDQAWTTHHLDDR